MIWASPAYAWLLLLGIPAAFLLRRAALRRHRLLRQFTGDRHPPRTRPERIRQVFAYLLPAAAFVLIALALCRPQWGPVPQPQQSKGLDILIALDVSRSMLADDLHPNRLAVAKAAVTSLLPHLQGDRIGLIAFAGSAFLVCPLTNDYATLGAVLAETGTDTIPLGGTSLTATLSEARQAFSGSEGRGKILLVISDGEDQGSDAAATVQALRSTGVTVYGVAAGTLAGGLIPLPRGDFLKNRQGNIVRSRMQTAPLLALATPTGGRLLDLTADPQALATLYATELATMERREIRGMRQQLAERFQLPLALALILLLIEPLIGRRSKS